MYTTDLNKNIRAKFNMMGSLAKDDLIIGCEFFDGKESF
jgi:hypothetical protein